MPFKVTKVITFHQRYYFELYLNATWNKHYVISFPDLKKHVYFKVTKLNTFIVKMLTLNIHIYLYTLNIRISIPQILNSPYFKTIVFNIQ